MIPKLSHIQDVGSLKVWVTTAETFGISFRIDLIDCEGSGFSDRLESIREWLRGLSPSVRVRFTRSLRSGREVAGSLARTNALQEVGFLAQDLIVSLEQPAKFGMQFVLPWRRRTSLVGEGEKYKEVLAAVESLKSRGNSIEPLSEEELREQFVDVRRFRVGTSLLDTGKECIGIVRLLKQPVHPVESDFLASRISELPVEIEIVTTCKRVDPSIREAILQTRLKQAESGQGVLDQKREEDMGGALLAATFEGAELFEMECLIVCFAGSEAELKNKLREVQNSLQGFGDVAVETFGCAPSFAASCIGSPMHVPIFEFDSGLPSFLPVATFGTSQSALATSKSGLVLHRRDESLDSLDLLSREHTNANGIIVGKSGKGKSVLTGLLTQSLLSDPSVSVIKVDVGGSHSRECELMGGTEYAFSLGQPSGLNPFQIAKHNTSESARAVLGKFIEVLVLGDVELKVPKEVAVEIDDLLRGFMASDLERSLEGFYGFARGFSRLRLLSRWVGQGLYKNAFLAKPGMREEGAARVQRSVGDGPHPGQRPHPAGTRLRYFNFSQIFEAGDPDYAQGVMAAVLAQFNLELLLNPEKRVVLICDETPFFIERCFEFFKFSQANVRKFGASVVLIVQLSQHLLKGGETSLIDNAHHRLLFSVDGSCEDFCNRLNLSQELVENIQGLQSVPRKFSESLYMSGSESKVLRIRQSPKEYWTTTSTSTDRMLLEKLIESVPGLSREAAIDLISQAESIVRS